MLLRLIFGLFCVSFLNPVASQTEIKRGTYPFMATIYYSDEKILDSNGSRFVRSAVLINAEWLISTAIDPEEIDGSPYGFPLKTLLAKAGAVTLDRSLSLNEDQDEQEKEIVKIVRPNTHNAKTWWLTGITMLKTLQPFLTTSAVAPASLTFKDGTYEDCSILVFTKSSNETEDKSLIEMSVGRLSASSENCGPYFKDDTMACSSLSDKIQDCQSNGGGPLLCKGELIGIQTFVDASCNSPFLFEIIFKWQNFIECNTKNKLLEEKCASLCKVTEKDYPVATDTPTTLLVDVITETKTTNLVKLVSEDTNPEIVFNTTFVLTESTPEHFTDTTASSQMPSTEQTETVPTSVLQEVSAKINDEKSSEEHRLSKMDGDEEIQSQERKPNVEAQLHEMKHYVKSGSVLFYQSRIILTMVSLFTLKHF